MSNSRIHPKPRSTIHSPLTLAAAKNDIDEVSRLIPTAEVNWQGIFGNTALHWAVANTNTKNADQKPIDMLTMSYVEATSFIQKYVRVFTLHKKIWDHNEEPIKKLLHNVSVTQNDNEEKAVFSRNTPTPLDSDFLETPQEFKKEFIGPPEVLFEQAIFYIEELIDPQYSKNHSVIMDSSTKFLTELRKLKDETMKRLNNKNLSRDAAQTLAVESLNLARKVANCTITKSDIDHFHKTTILNKKSALLFKIIGAIIGAAIGVFVGVMIGMAAGPVAAFTGLYGGAIGTSLGGALGGAIGFWSGKKLMAVRQSLTRLEASANEQVNQLYTLKK